MIRQLKETGKRFKKEIILYKRVLTDSRTPRAARWLLGAAVAYAISPIDLIPDFIPILGQLDDLLILPVLIYLALKIVPPHIIAEHRKHIHDKQA